MFPLYARKISLYDLPQFRFSFRKEIKMSLKDKLQMKEQDARLREAAQLQLYKNDKNFRADRLIAAWSKVPEIGAGLRQMPLQEARNVAINLDRQTNFMQNLRESQLATALNDFSPENMLRLVRLAMPNQQ